MLAGRKTKELNGIVALNHLYANENVLKRMAMNPIATHRGENLWLLNHNGFFVVECGKAHIFISFPGFRI